MTTTEEKIEETIHNPITKEMKPGQAALSSTISKAWPTKIAPDQVPTRLDKRENKIAHKRKPQD